MNSELRIDGDSFAALHAHLFPGDGDEHGAVILAGVAEGERGLRLLAREIHLLTADEFRAGEHGYRQFASAALARLGNRASQAQLALVTVHSHPGAHRNVRLSGDDLAGHHRVFPHLLDIVNGSPVAGVALGEHAAAGEIWHPAGTTLPLERVRVLGTNEQALVPGSYGCDQPQAERYDRQVRMFGTEGQRRLRAMRVGVIGAGGGGSLLIEQLAHLGIGSIVAIDHDTVAEHNLSRIVGASPMDAAEAIKKVVVAKRMVGRIDPTIEFVAIDGDVVDQTVAGMAATCDFLFLATDTHTSRLVVNALSHAHLVPAVQIGSKIEIRPTGEIETIYAAVRPILPGQQGCLSCAGLIDPLALQREAATPEERRQQNYLDAPEIIDPSVITLNAASAAAGVNVLLLSVTGLALPGLLDHRLFLAQDGSWLQLETPRDPQCPWCSTHQDSLLGRGDRAALPCRRTPRERPAHHVAQRRARQVLHALRSGPRAADS